MATVASRRSNVSAINDGEWVPINGDDPDNAYEIRTRGFTVAYKDALNALQRAAARKANRGLPAGAIQWTVAELPPSISDKCQGEALAEHVFLGVRGLKFTVGGPDVTADDFRDMLRDPEQYQAFLMDALSAAWHVHSSREEEAKAAVGNSQPASAGS